MWKVPRLFLFPKTNTHNNFEGSCGIDLCFCPSSIRITNGTCWPVDLFPPSIQPRKEMNVLLVEWLKTIPVLTFPDFSFDLRVCASRQREKRAFLICSDFVVFILFSFWWVFLFVLQTSWKPEKRDKFPDCPEVIKGWAGAVVASQSRFNDG